MGEGDKKRIKKTTVGTGSQLPAVVGGGGRALTAAEFQGLAQVPPEAEWFANIDNPRTRRAYRIDIHEFMQFLGIAQPEEFRRVTRAHVLAWRKTLEGRVLSGATIRRKLAALSSLFEHLCDANTVTHNPVKGVKRPKVENYEGKTPAKISFCRRRSAILSGDNWLEIDNEAAASQLPL